MKIINKLGLAILFLVLISPIGLILPNIFNAKSAWGEWDQDEIKTLIGYIPVGMTKISESWHPILPDYNFQNNLGGNLVMDSLAYIFSGLVGTLACIGLTLLWIKLSRLSIINATKKGHN